MAAIDRLLTDDNARHYGPEWMAAALPAGELVFVARGPGPASDLWREAARLAVELGRPYEAAVARFQLDSTLETALVAGELARERNDPFVAAMAQMEWIEAWIDADPQAALPLLDTDEVRAGRHGSTVLLDDLTNPRVLACLGQGDLRGCINLSLELTRSPSPVVLWSALSFLSQSALLARDEEALLVAAEAARRITTGSGTASLTEGAVQHRLGLLRGEPSLVEPHIPEHVAYMSTSTIHFFAKEALDAGGASVAVEAARAQHVRGPYPDAVLAAIEGGATDDEYRWHEALQIAAAHGLRLIAVDALEALAVAASRAESWVECLRLLGAARRLRDECHYRWRYPSEQTAIDEVTAAARDELSDDQAQTAETEGRSLPWVEAARYANRARGDRRRPRHGWASLTPTEEQVAALVVEGLSNPQIGERLLMSRSTVKTHLEHIFGKVGVRSRAELAARSARRDT
jgi:DNA-binding CsgD family transcriptional regulator